MAKLRFSWITFSALKLATFCQNLNKNAAANKKLSTKNYDLEIPILIIFGNGLAPGKLKYY